VRVVLGREELLSFFTEDEISAEEDDNKSYSGKQDDKPEVRIFGLGMFADRD
jgi:hypothetical protein